MLLPKTLSLLLDTQSTFANDPFNIFFFSHPSIFFNRIKGPKLYEKYRTFSHYHKLQKKKCTIAVSHVATDVAIELQRKRRIKTRI